MMIILGIVAFLGVVIILAIVIVGSIDSDQKKARKIIEQGHIDDLKEAKRILSFLGGLPTGVRTQAGDDLYTQLKALIDKV
ncbi:MAG: hypothetical protein KKD44_26260 [Proteobacteria bacterium]|nr:hypothetical protein [Pseudomonadota bacterium]